MAKQSFWAARPFGYGDQYPMLDVGQVIEIEVGQQKNDEAMIRLGLLRRLERTPVRCGKCGATLADENFLNMHGKHRHARPDVEAGREEDPNASLSTAAELGKLRAAEAADEFAEKSIPLNLDKSKANQEASAGRRASR